MNRLFPFIASAALLAAGSAPALGAGKAIGDMHPEEAYPDNLPRMTSPGPNDDFIKQVQERLHAEGFDAGPVNGDFGTKTQAALAQFQLANTLPASGMLDSKTLLALGVEPPSASAVSSAESAGAQTGNATSGSGNAASGATTSGSPAGD